MSSYYGQIYPEYWDGPTGLEIQRLGGLNALLLGAFMLSNRRSNMLGLYRLPLEDVTAAIRALTPKRVIAAIGALVAADFISYDFGTQFVWVHGMALVRLDLRNGKKLDPKDNRAIGARTLYAKLEDNPFLQQFFHRYGKILHLKRERTSELHHYISPLQSPLQGPLKPVNRSVRTSTFDPESTHTGDSTIPPDQAEKERTETAASRRNTRAQVNTQNPETADGPEGDPVAAALRDRESRDRGRADDRRQRVESTDEGSRSGTGVRHGSAIDVDEGAECGGTRPRGAMGTAAASGVAVGASGTERSAESGSAMAVAETTEHWVDDVESAHREPAALGTLKDVVRR